MRAKSRDVVQRDERGAGLVEFALVLPLLMALILGLVTGGLAYHRKISMTDAVREGARFGATLEDSAAWSAAVISRVASDASDELDAGDVCAKLIKTPATDLRSSACAYPSDEPANADVPADTCIVKVWARRDAKLEVIFFSTDIDLKAKGVAGYERDCP